MAIPASVASAVAVAMIFLAPAVVRRLLSAISIEREIQTAKLSWDCGVRPTPRARCPRIRVETQRTARTDTCERPRPGAVAPGQLVPRRCGEVAELGRFRVACGPAGETAK